MKLIKKIATYEEELSPMLDKLKVDYRWMIILCVWTLGGLYVYNELLPFRNVATRLVYYSITFFVISKNWQAVKVFFRNPFKTLEHKFNITNILWVYPFVIMLLSVPVVLFINSLGFIPDDPQNIQSMSLTLNEYMLKMLMTPLGVILEEAENVLLLVVVGKLIKDKVKFAWMPLTVMFVAILFGGMHVTAWGPEAAVNRMFIHLPFLFSILIFSNVWPCILAHLYQNWMTYTSVLIDGFSKTFVSYGLLLLILIMTYRELYKKWSMQKD